jgi:hypothetical protein
LTNPTIDSKTTTAIRIPYNWSLWEIHIKI